MEENQREEREESRKWKEIRNCASGMKSFDLTIYIKEVPVDHIIIITMTVVVQCLHSGVS